MRKRMSRKRMSRKRMSRKSRRGRRAPSVRKHVYNMNAESEAFDRVRRECRHGAVSVDAPVYWRCITDEEHVAKGGYADDDERPEGKMRPNRFRHNKKSKKRRSRRKSRRKSRTSRKNKHISRKLKFRAGDPYDGGDESVWSHDYDASQSLHGHDSLKEKSKGVRKKSKRAKNPDLTDTFKHMKISGGGY